MEAILMSFAVLAIVGGVVAFLVKFGPQSERNQKRKKGKQSLDKIDPNMNNAIASTVMLQNNELFDPVTAPYKDHAGG